MQQIPPTIRTRGPDSFILIHSSDIHVDVPSMVDPVDVDSVALLKSVVRTARDEGAAVILLAGDVFENNRLPVSLLEQAAQCLADANLPTVILPGNHDPLTPDSVYHRGGFNDLPGVNVLGMSDSDSVILESLDLEIWGRAHTHYGDMQPLRDPRPRRTRWQVAVAHGHALEPPYPERLRPSWLISKRDVNETGADYVALGHWDRSICLSPAPVPAYYSGSPRLTDTVNVVHFHGHGPVSVSQRPISREPD